MKAAYGDVLYGVTSQPQARAASISCAYSRFANAKQLVGFSPKPAPPLPKD